jgi:hypothetical protein
MGKPNNRAFLKCFIRSCRIIREVRSRGWKRAAHQQAVERRDSAGAD